jgi:hypothetical protein
MKKASEVWGGIGTHERTYLIDKYCPHIMPYYLQKPTDAQIIEVLTAARKDGYLIVPFIEYKEPA